MGPRPTSNVLNQQWMFVNKNSESEHLTRSSGAEKTKVYGHVRQHMVKDKLVVQEEFNQVFKPKRSTSQRKRLPRRTKPHPPNHGNGRVHPGAVGSLDVAEEESSKDIILSRSATRLGILCGPAPALNAAPYARSYEYFRQRTISDATSFADRQFWDASMQLSASSEAIFHALTSLGALHESLMNESSRHEFHHASLSHCNRAIRATVAGDQAMSLPMILVTCVIFTTIQIFGDAPMAQRTLESGIKLVALAQKQLPRFSSSERAMLDLVSRMIERYQSRLTLVLLPTTVVKEHLGHFGIMDDDMPKVPPGFESLLQAREILQAICDWSFHVVKSPRTLLLTDELQKQWIQAIIKLSESSGLHPLSMRSVNLLKIARLASACLITAQFMTRKIEIDEYFPTFLRVLELYSESFKLCKSNAIFTTVFHIDAGIIDVLRYVLETSADTAVRYQAQQALNMDLAQYGNHCEAEATSPLHDSDWEQKHQSDVLFRIKSLDFFAQSGLARLRLKRYFNSTSDTPTTEVRWFSILDTTEGAVFPQSDGREAILESYQVPITQWTQDVPVRNDG